MSSWHLHIDFNDATHYVVCMTRLRHYDDWGTARFVTFSTYRRLQFLTSTELCVIVIKFLDQVRIKYAFKLLAYVLMPDHVHLVLFPPDGMPLGLMIRELKSRSAREFLRQHPTVDGTSWPTACCGSEVGSKRQLWQRRCYDHNCRTPESTLEKIEYCHANPVRKGLVSHPSHWRWSSYNWYQGERDVPIQLDAMEAY